MSFFWPHLYKLTSRLEILAGSPPARGESCIGYLLEREGRLCNLSHLEEPLLKADDFGFASL